MKWSDFLGLDFGLGVDSAAAGGNGHTTLYTQSPSGDWYAYNQGAAGATASGGNYGFLTGSNAPAGASNNMISGLPPGVTTFPTTPAQDSAIMSCANASVNDHNSGASSYNLYSNNCTDAVVDVLSCAGISVPNPIFTVKPNEWIKLITPTTPTFTPTTPAPVPGPGLAP